MYKLIFIIFLVFIIYILQSLYTTENWTYIKKNKIELVIARYHEPLDWLYKIDTSNIRVICYNKDEKDFSHPKVNKVINLPNVGKCDHTYLYHIITNYDNLADVTIFTAGSCDMDYKWEQFLFVFNNAIEHLKTSFYTSKYNNVKQDLYNFVIEDHKTAYAANKNDKVGSKTELCNIRPFGKWYEKYFGDLVINDVNYRAMFSATRSDILKRDLNFYKLLIEDVKTPNPECGHFIERSWVAIFN
jgi:hypothetical protein